MCVEPDIIQDESSNVFCDHSRYGIGMIWGHVRNAKNQDLPKTDLNQNLLFNKLPRADSIEVWEELFCDVRVIMVVAILRTNGIFNFSGIKEN